MSISILNRGASGGLKPELTVTAPAGSTIDLLQNGIITDTYTLGASETEHTFIVELGTYTVRGTLGTDAKSKDVLIDTVGQYDVKISYFNGMLYDNGNEYEIYTGGWDGTITSDAALYQYTRNATNMSWSSTGQGQQIRYACTENLIDCTGFTKLEMNHYFNTSQASYGSDIDNWSMAIEFRDEPNGLANASISIWSGDAGSTSMTGTKTYTLPESVLNTERRICIKNYFGWVDKISAQGTIYSVRLLP